MRLPNKLRNHKSPPAAPRERRSLYSDGNRRVSSPQAFSYYARSRPQESAARRSAPAAGGQTGSSRSRLERPDFVVEEQGRFRRRAGLANHLVGLLCGLVIVASFIKITAVEPHSKVMMHTGGAALPTQTTQARYAAATDAMLRHGLLNRNKITLDSAGISRQLQRQFPELASVTVAVPIMGNRPVIHIFPADEAFVLQTSHGRFGLDAHGYVLESAVTASSLPTLREMSSRMPKPGEQYLSRATVSFAQNVVYQLDKQGIAVQYVDLPADKPYELDVYVENKPYYIRCNIQEDALEQSGAAVAALQHLGTSTPAHYLDVRVSGRVFYK